MGGFVPPFAPMEVLNLIVPIEKKLKAYVRLLPAAGVDNWLLEVQLYHDGGPVGKTSFNLHGYTQAEAEQTARNIRSNEYLMQEIDHFLWSEEND
jgi:hypothetical protein